MLSHQAEKRMVSSIFIILAPPRRGCGGPAKAPPVLPTEKLVPRKEGRGASSSPGAVSSARLAPPLDPPHSVEAVLRSLQPSAALPVETLGPGLQKGAAALPSPLQTSGVEEPPPASPLGWTDGQAQEEVAAPDICAFCHKGISPDALALEAMRKQYHVRCFTCRTCHSSLAGKSYYQKEGRPLCTACYQETLEKCDACQDFILHEIVWALGKGYHPECFTCVACSRQIGSDAFAVDDEHQALCLPDFYRRFAPICGVCEEPIIPRDGRDAYKIECLGRSFHEDCYRCEKCQVLLSLEPTEDGCYPLGSRLFCQACYVWQTRGPPAAETDADRSWKWAQEG
ncbi:filamin-binding LIM protein 1 [Crotalus tigris]|uniref:filamin-binding LIM protein 1 n=1 Tax=Crotalus tigris TaxID=88082 RepID=UPI00192F2C63|nr:filamin-binding LIM protein 1 [Crotalus tigris]XP_039223086.1 filamin-binding LIM protein 1 [Crotalus tigris]